jgi:RNA polymerase sigma factor (TIGR02999 family)
MSEVTQILNALSRGESQAANDLLPLIYEELRKLAAQKMAQEQPGQTLQPTALVHEAFLRLVGPANADGFANRRHFFAAAAEAMRRILIDQARRKKAQPARAQSFDIGSLTLQSDPGPEAHLAVNEVLDELAQNDPECAELVKLRFYAGMSMPEAAQAMDQPLRSIERLWTFARAWFYQRLNRSFSPTCDGEL